MSDFSRQVSAAFRDPIARNALRIESSDYSWLHMGNAYVILAGTTYRLRVERDRGDITADVAGNEEPDDWFPLQWAIAAVSDVPVRPPGFESVQEAAALFISMRTSWKPA
jgi:hypothetical protein